MKLYSVNGCILQYCFERIPGNLSTGSRGSEVSQGVYTNGAEMLSNRQNPIITTKLHYEEVPINQSGCYVEQLLS